MIKATSEGAICWVFMLQLFVGSSKLHNKYHNIKSKIKGWEFYVNFIAQRGSFKLVLVSQTFKSQ